MSAGGRGCWGQCEDRPIFRRGLGVGAVVFFFGWCWILYGFTGGVGAAKVRKWQRSGRGSGDWRAGKGLGGVFEAARVNGTALARRGKAGLSGGYYGVGGVQLGFFG